MNPMRTCGLNGQWFEREGFRCLKVPGKTSEGAPWLRWAALEHYAGWYAIGTRQPDFGPRPTFWQNVYLLAADGCVDAVHCIGPAILSVGGLGVTVSSGLAQSLLGACLEASPGYFLHCMAPLIQRTGVYPECLGVDPEQYGFVQLPDRELLMEDASLERALRGGSDGISWSPEGKAIAGAWVEAIALMLRSDAFDRVQVEFCAEQLPALLTEDLLREILWPKSGARDAWQWTSEQQALWAMVLSLALEDSGASERLTGMALAGTAAQSLNNMWTIATISPAQQVASLSDAFRKRAVQLLMRARELFHLDLEFDQDGNA